MKKPRFFYCAAYKLNIPFLPKGSYSICLLSRAFYGWISHVRHVRTVRRQLGSLAFHAPLESCTEEERRSWCDGVTEGWWLEERERMFDPMSAMSNGVSAAAAAAASAAAAEDRGGRQKKMKKKERVKAFEDEIYRRIYFGGIQPELRKTVGITAGRVVLFLFGLLKGTGVAKTNRYLNG
jgi:hypothetical protein